MKRILTVFLMLSMIVALFSGMAFAVEETDSATVSQAEALAENEAITAFAEQLAAEEPAQPKQSNVKSVFNSAFYVEANETASLVSKVTVTYDLGGSTGTLYLPGKTDASALRFCWDDADLTVSRDGVTYQSGEAPVAAPGESITYKVTKGAALALVTIKTVQGSADVEPMFLELDESMGTIDAMNADETHEATCYGKVLFDGIDKAVSIKGRGNSTWKFPKKPYNITLYKTKNGDPWGKKDGAELIPGVEAKKWSLLANHLDNSLIRNKIAMDLANGLGIGLGARFVDIWMNGEYLGNYLMTPKNDYKAPNGGFALENDNYLDNEDPQFNIPGMFAVGDVIHDDGYYNLMTVKDIGDDAVDAGVDAAYIENYFTQAWNALEDFSSEDYQNYFDMDSWAKMFLMYEVSKTYDCFAGSLLMHRDGLTESDKLVAGPAWDYDVSFGRTLHKFLVGVTEPTQLNAEGWYVDSIGLVGMDKPVSLLQELGKHASFMQRVAEVYNANKDLFEGIAANVETQREVLRKSALMNNVLWGTHSLCADYLVAPNTMRMLGTGKYALNYDVTFTWENYVNNVGEFAAKRVLWLSDHLALQAPEGAVSKQAMADGTVVLQAVLTAGNSACTYQWQRSADGENWTDIGLATTPKLVVKPDQAGEGLYRCVVTNAGAVINTFHGGQVPTFAQTVLAPADVTVRMAETPIHEGALTLVMNGEHVGEYTFAQYEDGWSIQNPDGKYLGVTGRVLEWGKQPTAWKLDNGVFSTEAMVAVTGLGRLLTWGRTQTVYLNVVAGAPAFSATAGAAVTFLQPVAG